MERGYCKECEKRTTYKRELGFGTLFAVAITMGLWIFVIPFYPKRCKRCGATPSLFQFNTMR